MRRMEGNETQWVKKGGKLEGRKGNESESVDVLGMLRCLLGR